MNRTSKEFYESVSKLAQEGKTVNQINEALYPIYGEGVKYDSLRRRIAKVLAHPALYAECQSVGIDMESVSSYWHKGKHFSINVKNEKDSFDLEDFKKQLIEDIKKWPQSIDLYTD